MNTPVEPGLIDEEIDADGLDEAEGEDTSADPMLEAVLWLCRHHGIERSAHSLLNGARPQGPLTPAQAVEVLKSAGFSATLVRRPPGKILGMLMPVVMVLRNGDAVILTKRLTTRKRGGTVRYEVVMPGGVDEVCTATEEELMPEFSGYMLLAAVKAGAHAMRREAAAEDASHWLWSTLRTYLPYYRGAMVAALLSNILMLLTGVFMSVVYDKVIPHHAMSTLWSLGVAALLGVLFDWMSRQLRSHLIDIAGKKADLAMGNMLFQQAVNIRLEHKPESAGAFAHKLAQIEVVREFYTSASSSVLTDIPFIALFVFMTAVIAGPLAWVIVGAIPLVLGLSFSIQKVLRRQMAANMHQQADLQGTLVAVVEGLEDVRAAGAQGYFAKRYEAANAAAANSSLRARTVASVVTNVSAIMQPLMTIVMLLWGVVLIQEGHITSGSLMGAVMFSGRAISPLSSIVGLAGRFQGARAAMRVLNDLMAIPTERDPEKQYLSRPSIKGALALRDVSFSYPKGGREHAPKVLKGVNLEIRAGEKVAILGKIGSGKSTILRLLAGLYMPSDGFVEVDGIDLRQIDPMDFRTHVGFVSQEPRLFQGSLRENVLLGRAHADLGRFQEVARQTGLDKLASAHPMGYDLPVGEMGSLLSGGQRQLVALARCLVTNSQVLLMDEPTSSMDAQSESTFIRHLKTAVNGQTLIVVTHRPALLDVVDRVIVVDGGRILADGPKAQVLAALAGQRPPSGPQAVPASAQPVQPVMAATAA